MKKYRVGLLAFTLTSVAALAAANAADMYVPGPAGPGGYKDAPFVSSWAGFYVGVNGGYGWDASKLDVGAPNPAGGFGGGQIGYNWQGAWHPHLVLGIEADIQGSGISDSVSVIPGLVSGKSELDWFGTVRGRLGYSFGSALIYGTGGFAYGNVTNSITVLGVTASRSETQTGWVAGGGIEYKIAPNWSAKAEYQFLSLDANDPNGPGRLGDFESGRSEVHTVRAGLNYFVGSTYAPLK
jgi:outer membrane immunogenic protein